MNDNLSPSGNGLFFKAKSKIQVYYKPDNGEIITVRCHIPHILLRPAVVGRACDPEIGRISHFQKEGIY